MDTGGEHYQPTHQPEEESLLAQYITFGDGWNDDIFFPPLMRSELNSDSNRYDRLKALPSPNELEIMWLVWSVLAGAIALYCLVFICGVLRSSKTRKQPFNLYLIAMTVPDMLFSAMCALTCALNVRRGGFYPPNSAGCLWQGWYVTFDFTANAWLNAAVAQQVHKLLQSTAPNSSSLSCCRWRSQHRPLLQRYHPPTVRQVLIQSAMVYLYATFVASWTIISAKIHAFRIPHRAYPIAGLACLPVEYSPWSTAFFWCLFFPAFMGIPLMYTLWVAFDVYRRGLMPSLVVNGNSSNNIKDGDATRSGSLTGSLNDGSVVSEARKARSRQLAIFFFRLVGVFVLMWVPSIVFIYIVAVPGSVWITWAGGTWSHMQAFFSVTVCFTKPDVRNAVADLFPCFRCGCNPSDKECTSLKCSTLSTRRRSSTDVSFVQHKSRLERLEEAEKVNDEECEMLMTQSETPKEWQNTDDDNEDVEGTIVNRSDFVDDDNIHTVGEDTEEDTEEATTKSYEMECDTTVTDREVEDYSEDGITYHEVDDDNEDGITDHEVDDDNEDGITDHEVDDDNEDGITDHEVDDDNEDDITNHKIDDDNEDDITNHKIDDDNEDEDKV